MGNINSEQLKMFLSDYVERSETIILEEGSEKNEIFKIAEKHGILLKDSKDLAGFKTIYAFTDKPNANGAILPKKELLRALPTLVGKPIDIDHNRKYVIGYYIDYKYIQKSGTIIAYGIFFKSNFAGEWEEAKKLFKEKKLATSFEIWSPKDKRKFDGNGNYELYDMEIAGGALLYKEDPAFKNAKVLEIAKKNIEKKSLELVYAKKQYKEEELIYLSNFPGSNSIHINCTNCGNSFEVFSNKEYYKCPFCDCALDKNGNVLSLKTEGNLRIVCPSCRHGEWAIIEEGSDYNKMKCLFCGNEYKFIFEAISSNFINPVFLLEANTSCIACGSIIDYSFYSNQDKVLLKCPVCSLKYEIEIEKQDNNRKITKIEKASLEGGKEMKIEIYKFHRYIEVEDSKYDEFAENFVNELEEAKKLTYQERKKLPDEDFAIIIRVKNKKTGGMRKIRMFPIYDEAHVRNALARLDQEKVTNTLKMYKISKQKVLKKILQKAKELKMYELLLRHKEDCKKLGIPLPKNLNKSSVELEKLQEELKKKELEMGYALQTAYEKRKKSVLKLKELRKKMKEEIEKAKKKAEEKVKFYMEKAKKIIERRNILGEYGNNMTDEQLLDDKEFEIARLKKENEELKKASLEKASDSVGKIHIDDVYLEIQKEINKRAFGSA